MLVERFDGCAGFCHQPLNAESVDDGAKQVGGIVGIYVAKLALLDAVLDNLAISLMTFPVKLFQKLGERLVPRPRAQVIEKTE